MVSACQIDEGREKQREEDQGSSVGFHQISAAPAMDFFELGVKLDYLLSSTSFWT